MYLVPKCWKGIPFDVHGYLHIIRSQMYRSGLGPEMCQYTSDDVLCSSHSNMIKERKKIMCDVEKFDQQKGHQRTHAFQQY